MKKLIQLLVMTSSFVLFLESDLDPITLWDVSYIINQCEDSPKSVMTRSVTDGTKHYTPVTQIIKCYGA